MKKEKKIYKVYRKYLACNHAILIQVYILMNLKKIKIIMYAHT